MTGPVPHYRSRVLGLWFSTGIYQKGWHDFGMTQGHQHVTCEMASFRGHVSGCTPILAEMI